MNDFLLGIMIGLAVAVTAVRIYCFVEKKYGGYGEKEVYAIALGCDIDRRLASIGIGAIRFNIGKTGFTEFTSVLQARDFVEYWHPLTIWNWKSYVIVKVDEKGKSWVMEKIS